jgi:hypothetical protein
VALFVVLVFWAAVSLPPSILILAVLSAIAGLLGVLIVAGEILHLRKQHAAGPDVSLRRAP